MKRPYSELRVCMFAKGILQRDLCTMLGRKQSYITKRMTGQASWEQDEMYKLLDVLDVPYDRLHEMFPPHGKTNGK